MTNPVRNHLQLSAGKLGERMDTTGKHLCLEIARVLEEYRDGLLTAPAALRELDAVQALCAQHGTILGSTRLVWEGADVYQWLPLKGSTSDARPEEPT